MTDVRNRARAEVNRATRVPGRDVAAGGDVQLSPGGAAELVNLSESGALVETSTRFSTGAVVALCIGGARPQRLPGRVVRCQVCGIHRDNTMTYQLGIAFESTVRAEVPGAEDASPAAAPVGAEAPLAASVAGLETVETAAVETAMAAIPGPEAPELVNEW